ncbi:MAG: hypothetical protein VYD19_08325 [Myxococcota bacterium]|nr:hypothetical protein [Myxococcota bacterium]
MRRRFFNWALWFALLSITAISSMKPLSAAPSPEKVEQDQLSLPAPLEPWRDWLLAGQPERKCARGEGGALCTWPTALVLQLGETQGRFSLRARLDRAAYLPLPGAGAIWPESLRDEEQRELIVERDSSGRPQVWLSAGTYGLHGIFRWQTQPEFIQVPAGLGLIQLYQGAIRVAHPRRDDQGRLWLNAEAEATTEADQLRLEVHRQLRDGVPLSLETRLLFSISGRARHLELQSLLPRGARALSLEGDLPAEWSEGQLRLYLLPGRHQVTIHSVIASQHDEIELPTLEGISLESLGDEIWTWREAQQLRSVELSGLSPIDPEQTSLNPIWRRSDAVFKRSLSTSEQLKIRELRRGQAERLPDDLQLTRTLWLDPDGVGFASLDEISGTLNQSERLNYAQDGVLGRVSLDGEGVLITRDPESGLEGVELREREINVGAELRSDERVRPLPAVGWAQRFSALMLKLKLPPGWLLIDAPGTMTSTTAWLRSWSLADLFLTLLLVIGTGKLFGPLWGGCALVTLILGHSHSEVVITLWISLLFTLALLRLLPPGLFPTRLIQLYRLGTIAALFLVFIPFARLELRFIVHPQLDSAPSPLFHDRSLSLQERYTGLQRVKRSPRKANWLQRNDPNAIVQTGRGLPTWKGRTHQLYLKGPITEEVPLQLWLLPPSWHRVLRLLRLILFALISLLLFDRRGVGLCRALGARGSKRAQRESALSSMSTGGVIFLCALAGSSLSGLKQGYAQPVQSLNVSTGNALTGNGEESLVAPAAGARRSQGGTTFPPDWLLQEATRRLESKRGCTSRCVTAPSLTLRLRGTELTLKAPLHSAGASFFQLPFAGEKLVYEGVRLNGREAQSFLARRGESLLLRLPRGISNLEASARLREGTRALSIQFPDRPQRVIIDASNWQAQGLDEQGQLSGPLELVQEAQEGADQATTPAAPLESRKGLAPWYIISRHVVFSLPWQVETTISRQRSEDSAALSFPLLPGERPLSAKRMGGGPPATFSVQGDQLRLEFPAGVNSIILQSELLEQESLTLHAPEGRPWVERWGVSCGSIWQCEVTGLNPIPAGSSLGDAALQEAQQRWAPWPGESLKIKLRRPLGVPGPSRTVRALSYLVTAGVGRVESELTLTVGASRGQQLSVTLPEGAIDVHLSVDRERRYERPQGREFLIPVSIGEHRYQLKWQQPETVSHAFRPAPLTLDGELVNAQISLRPGTGRWILWGRGPGQGPAILFWGELLTLFLFALALSRIPGLPLGVTGWFLFGFGFTQLGAGALGAALIWFAAFRLRSTLKLNSRFKLNAYQLMLFGGTGLFGLLTMNTVYHNLLSTPEMGIIGRGSNQETLTWYLDRWTGTLPEPIVYWWPHWCWQLLMLTWSLWFAWALIGWLRWAWAQANVGTIWWEKEEVADTGAETGEPVDKKRGRKDDLGTYLSLMSAPVDDRGSKETRDTGKD